MRHVEPRGVIRGLKHTYYIYNIYINHDMPCYGAPCHAIPIYYPGRYKPYHAIHHAIPHH